MRASLKYVCPVAGACVTKAAGWSMILLFQCDAKILDLSWNIELLGLSVSVLSHISSEVKNKYDLSPEGLEMEI